MELSVIAFEQIGVLVVLMVIGFGCAKVGLIDERTNKQLSNLLLMLVNPVLIFLSYQRSFEPELLQGLLWALALSGLSFMIITAAAHVIYAKSRLKDVAIERFSLVYTNAGFLGIPLVNGLFGSEGVFYLTGYLTVFFLFFWTHGMIVMGGKREMTAIKKGLVSPPILAILAGFGLFIAGISLPTAVDTPLRLLSHVNTPLAMLVAGVSLSKTHWGQLLRHKRLYAVCALRLLVLPASVMAVVGLLPAPPLVRATVIVLSACPVAANVILFAYRYDQNPTYASEVFAATTVLSLFTIPLLLFFL